MSGGLLGRDSVLADVFAACREERFRGFVISGVEGLGRSTLLASIGASLTESGREVLSASATRAAAGVQYAALAHLLPELPPGSSELEILESAHRHLRGRAAARPTVLLLDDAHHLDMASATLVHQLVVAGSVFIVLTVRSDTQASEPILAIMERSDIGTHDLAPLSETEAAAAVRLLLGGPVAHLTVAEVLRLSGRNPKYLHRVVTDGVGMGTLEEFDGVWRQTGSLVSGPGVRQLVAETLDGRDRDEVRALELLALASSIPFARLESLVDLVTLDKVESAGLMAIDPDCAMSSAFMTSELLAEALRDGMPRARLRLLSRQLAESADQSTASREGEFTAAWLLDAGDRPDAATCVAAARRALASGDFATAERFARAGIDGGAGTIGSLLLGEALVGLGRTEDAERVLLAAHQTADEDAHIAQATLARMRNLRYFAGRPDEASAIGVAALERLESDDWKDEVSAEIALHAGLAGDYTAAVAAGRRVLDRPDASARAVVGTLMVSTQGLVMLGSFDEAVEAARRGLRLSHSLGEELPGEVEALHLAEFQAKLFGGSLAEAEQISVNRLSRAVEQRSPAATGLWEACCGAAQFLQGRFAESVQTYCAATTQLRDADPLRALPVTSSWRALAEVQAGMIRGAEMTLARTQPEYLPEEFRVKALRTGVEAWIRAQLGDSVGAARSLRDAGMSLIDHTHVVWGVMFLHDAVRLGHAGLVANDLATAARVVDGPLIAAMVHHARAFVDRDGDALLAVGDEFAAIGALLLAAEGVAQGAMFHQEAGAHQAAGRASTRAAALVEACEGADTPALRGRTPFLTRREEEIARLAVQGLSSRAISERLVISRRTVDNHLGSVYTKLGLHGRDELAELIPVR